MKIGVYGYYNRGNFGDDLMAAIVHHELRTRGYETLVFGMNPLDAKDLGMETEPDPDRLVRECDVFLLGGGGVFIRHAHPWKAVVEGYAELGRLLALCEQRRVPVFGVSMGGSGTADFPAWQESAARFGRQARFYTVRNAADLGIAASFGRRDVECFPDIVWSTPEIFPQQRVHATRPLILNHLGAAHSRVAKIARHLYFRRLRSLRTADVVNLDTTAQASPSTGETKGGLRGDRYKFSRLRDDLKFLAQADLVFTTRLHTGLAALSYGAGMLSLYGEEKGRLMMRAVGIEQNFLTGPKALRAWLRLKNPVRFVAEVPRLPEEERQRLAKAARTHVARLAEHLKSVTPSKNRP